ncbi:MAG: N-acetylglucosamine-6-phosphate deacetylase [Planctomycetota bacterium]
MRKHLWRIFFISSRNPVPLRYVDLQINGLAGIDLNSIDLPTGAWHAACLALGQDGTSNFLPTLITDSVERLSHKLKRLGELVSASTGPSEAIPLGIHLEGPFLSSIPGYIGAHPSQFARDADLEQMKRWHEISQGNIRMVTLAPERDPDGACTRWLADQGVVVAAGHTDASLDQLKLAIDNGLTLFTHLGNACPMLLPRHDNIILRALSLRRYLRYTMIADGHHLPYWLVADWVDRIGSDRVAFISDAISAACLPAGIYRLGERSVRVGDDGVPRSEDGSHFVGSGMTLGMMDRHLARHCPWSAEARTKLFRDNAAEWLGIDLHATP